VLAGVIGVSAVLEQRSKLDGLVGLIGMHRPIVQMPETGGGGG